MWCARAQVTGCKLCCPNCESNQFVLTCATGGLNVDDMSKIRFGWGTRDAFMIVQGKYICCNPSCTAVQGKMKDNGTFDLDLQVLVRGLHVCGLAQPQS